MEFASRDGGWDPVTKTIIAEIECAWTQLLGAQRMQELRQMLEDLTHN